jgi:transcriptional regulator with XRE-family HTH domain
MSQLDSPSRKKKPAAQVAKAATEPAWSHEVAHEAASEDISPAVAQNLKSLRTKKALSLEKLAQRSGVSRAMLSQIELGQSTPTINVLWKIAVALEVPFSALIRSATQNETQLLPKKKAKLLMSHDGKFASRALFPFDVPRSVEFYELRLLPEGREDADAHAPGTMENLVVTAGELELHLGEERHRLETGDAIFFRADLPHSYINPGATETRMYLVMSYESERSHSNPSP